MCSLSKTNNFIILLRDQSIGKGNKFREVVINGMMYSALVDYLKERNEIKTDNPYLFVTQKNKSTKKPLNRNFCNRLLDKYGEICNIQNLTPHKLRAFFCNFKC